MSQGALPLGRLRPGLQPRGLEVHTFVAFVDIKKAFDSCWVETTLVRLHDVGISSRLWHLLANFLCGPLSQVRLSDSAYQPWVDSGVAQGRVLSPLLLVGQPCHLSPCCRPWCSPCGLGPVCQLHADDLVILAESQAHLQRALDVAHESGTPLAVLVWCRPHQICGYGLRSLSAAAQIVSVHFGGVSFPLVPQYRCLGLTLTPTLSLRPHVDLVCAWRSPLPPNLRLVSWRRSSSLSPHLSSSLTSFPVRHLVWSSSAMTPQHFSNSTYHSVAGAVIFLGGPMLSGLQICVFQRDFH